MSSHFQQNDYRARGHRSYKRTSHGKTQTVKASGAQKLGAGVAGALVTPAGQYKGWKNLGLDSGLSRGESTAIGVIGPLIPVGGAVVGMGYQGVKAYQTGYLNASRATNRESTQKKKRQGKRTVPRVMNALIGERK